MQQPRSQPDEAEGAEKILDFQSIRSASRPSECIRQDTVILSAAVEIAVANQIRCKSLPRIKVDDVAIVHQPEPRIQGQPNSRRPVSDQEVKVIVPHQDFARAIIFDFGGAWDSSDDDNSDENSDENNASQHNPRSNSNEDNDWVGKSS